MIFALLIGVGLVGIGITLWVNHPKMYHQEIPHGEPWYILHPENFESGLTQELRRLLREFLKWLLIRLIALYRVLSEKITIKQVLKKRVRAFLYDHRHGETYHPSEFWHKVRHPKHSPHLPSQSDTASKTVETRESL